MEFNRIIKLLRKERGITQKQAAEDLGVSQALLSHYEKGIRECGLDFVVRVADYYNVSCDYLLGRSAERNGMMLTADELPNPDKMKDNVYHGSVLPTMNKKLISNGLNVLYAKIAECHSKALTTEVSSYLMMAVAKMFRLLYSAEPHNASSMFSIEPHRWHGYSDAVMRMAEANVEALLDGQDDIFIYAPYGKSYHKLIGNKRIKNGDKTCWRGVYTWFETPVADDADLLCYEGSAGGHTAVFIDCKRACKRTLALPGYLDLRHFGTAEQNGGIRISAAGRNKLKIKAGAPGSCVLLLRE